MSQRLLQRVAGKVYPIQDRLSLFYMGSPVVPAQQEREQALRQVLESQTFARSEQLKNFLRYVCELEISGRASEIKEYSIGVEALGRPASYSTTADSSVRRRAFELRHKLEEVYAGELASSDVRIDLPKGSYVPVFRFKEGDPPPPAAPVAEIHEPVPEVAAEALPQRSGFPLAWLATAALAGLLTGALAVRWLWTPAAMGSPAILSEAWGPLIAPQENVLICVASNFHMTVRSGGFATDSGLPTFPAPREIYGLFQKSNPLPEGSELFMRPAPNVATLGVVGGVAAAATVLRAHGTHYQILPERSAPLPSFRNRNVILFGDPTNSYAATQLHKRAHLAVAQDPATNRLILRDQRRPVTDPPAFSRREGKSSEATEVYGLMTVLPTDAAPGEQRRTFLVSGVSQVGIQGAMEYFSSPERLRELKSRFLSDGLQGFPRAYQLVVKCTAEDSLPLSCGYAAHYLLER